MKISLVSDIHLEHHRNWMEALYPILEDPTEVLVIAGDLCPINLRRGNSNLWLSALQVLCSYSDHVIYVLGNHEHYGTKEKEYAIVTTAASKIQNLHILQERTVEVNGVTFAGASLWFDPATDAAREHQRSLNDFRWIYDATSRIAQWHHEALNFFDGLTVDVVITHHAPSHLSVSPMYASSPLNCYFANNIDEIVDKISPKIWCHGHMHAPSDYHIKGSRVLCNPMGYPGENAHWNPLIIDMNDIY